MRVAFNARLLHAQSLRGWNRYTVNLLIHLPPLGIEPLLYTDRPLHPDHLARLSAELFPVRLAPPMRYFQYEQRWLGRQCAKDRVDILHCPLNFGLPRVCPCPRVLTLHDAIGQVYYGRQTSLLNRLKPSSIRNTYSHWIARRCAERVITVSEHAKGDLVRRLGLAEQKVSVTYEAAEEHFSEPINDERRRQVAAKHNLHHPYIFYIGGWEQRKNLPFLLRAFAAADLTDVELVLGGGNDSQRAPLQELASSLGIGQRLRLLGWVDDADLPAMYAKALCFAYPSEYEGFGLQLCEAMAVGCPTLAANATSLPEVLGDGGETFSLESPQQLASLLRRIHLEPEYRRALIERARRRSAFFSWKRMAEQTVAIYREMIRVA